MKTLAGFVAGTLAAFFLFAGLIGSFAPDPVGNVDPIDIDTGSDAIVRRTDDDGDDDLADDDTPEPSPSPTATAKPTATPTSTPTTRPTPTDATDDDDSVDSDDSD